MLMGLSDVSSAVVAAGSAWGDHGTVGTLSTTTIANGTWTADNSFTWTTARGTQGYSNGLHYVEFEILQASGGNEVVGLADATTATGAALDTYPGDFARSCGTIVNNGGGIAIGAGFACATISSFSLSNGDILAIAWDATNGFYYLAKNNGWLNSGDPTSGATGTGAVGTITAPAASPTLYPVFGEVKNGSVKIKTASFTYTPPSGYSAWG